AEGEAGGEHERRPRESGWRILTALVTLALAATVFGLLGSPLLDNALQRFVYYGSVPHLEPLSAQWLGFILGTLVAAGGVLLAWLLYGSKRMTKEAPEGLTRTLQRRYYLDAFYYRLFAGPLTRVGLALPRFDREVIDGAVDGLAKFAPRLGDALRRLQTGRVDHYAWTLALGALLLVIALGLRQP
ncbi:MAG: hypothetical protein M3511_11235, partial [Deinococcota bacterium]|nr:hypothetical protein [Deinococcota bacterium]